VNLDLDSLDREQLGRLLGEVIAKLLAPPVPTAAPATPPKLLSAKDLAARWNVPSTWVLEQHRSGRLRGRKFGKYVRFEESAVRTFEQTDHAALVSTRGVRAS
jgi:hypothetical protein